MIFDLWRAWRAQMMIALGRLRCVACRRRPTKDEATEMFENFGHKTSLWEVPTLVWRCLACGQKTGLA